MMQHQRTLVRRCRVAPRNRRLLFESLEVRRVLVNQPPEITLPAPFGAVEDILSPVPGIEISDPDIGSGNLQVKLQVAVGQFSATPVGSATVAGNGTSNLTLLGSLVDVSATLATLTYLSVPNDNGAKAFSVEADDLGNTGGPAQKTTVFQAFNVAARNDGPITTVPGPFSTPLNTPLDFGGIVTSDIDAGGSDIQVKLKATGGLLSFLGDKSGLSGIYDDFTFEILNPQQPLHPVLSFVGTVNAINSVLAANVRFTPTPGFAGPASILVETDDLGQSGGGGAKQDTDTIAINVLGPPPNPNQVINTGAGHDSILLRLVGQNLVATNGASTLLDVEFSLLSSVTFNTEGGNDQLTVDTSGGNPIPAGGVYFNGGSPTVSPGDRLSVVGTGTETATYRPDGAASAALDNDGTVMVDGRTITFTGLEPLDMIGMAVANVVFPNANDAITLADGLTSGGDATIVVSGTSQGVPFEAVALRSNTLVNIDTTSSDGIDTVTITSADSAHGNANLNVTTGMGGGDMIDVNGPVVFPGNVSLATQQIDFNNVASVVTASTVSLHAGSGPITDASPGIPSVAATALVAVAGTAITLGTQVGTLNAAVTAAGAISITEADGIVLASVTAANGPITINAAGTSTVTSVFSATDADASDISITTSSGDLTIATVTAGAGAAADVTLQATTGSIFDDDNDATLITADVLTFVVDRAVGRPGAVADLDSTANAWVLTATGAGPFVGTPVPGHWVSDTNSITITSATTVDGLIILDSLTGTMTATSVNANGAGRNVRLRALDGDLLGSFIRSGGGSITLNAEDNFSLLAGSLIQAATTVLLTSLDGADAGGSTFTFAGDVDAALLTLTGLGEADTFNVRPDGDGPGGDLDTPISIFGAAPVVAPGDVLNLDITGQGVPTLIVGPGPNNGIYSFAAAAGVTYDSIETVNNGGGAVNLVLDMLNAGFQTGGGDSDEIFIRLDEPGTNLLIDVDGVPVFQGADATINSLTILGSGDNDVLRIAETAGGLPDFLGAAPVLSPPPSTSAGSHLNATADSFLDAATGGVASSDVTIHFDGKTGADSLRMEFTTAHVVQYTSDTADAANSGNIGVLHGVGNILQTLLSFANLAPISLVGAGGTLIADASSTPATSSLLIAGGALVNDGITRIDGDGGFEQTDFSGFTGLVVRGGDGSETIDLADIDVLSGLTNITLDGDNLTNTDTANDLVRVQQTKGLVTTVRILGGQGNDTFQVHSDPHGALSIDSIAGQVFVSPIAGPGQIDDPAGSDTDRLIVDDRADPTGDSVLITQNSIDGITGFAGAPDVDYRSIDVLDLTATSAGDEIDAQFEAGSDLDTVNLSGWTGGDQFFLRTSDEQPGGPATGIQTINLFGDALGNPNLGDGNDIFGQSLLGVLPGTPEHLAVRLIRPSISTLIKIDGGRPTAVPNPPVQDQVGDELNLDVSALAPPVIVATLGANPSLPGIAQSVAAPPSHRPVSFVEIEDINLVDGGILTDVGMGDLYVRGSNNVDSVSFLATANPNVARVQVNAFQGYFTITRRVVVYARGGNDYLQLGNFNHPAEFYGGAGDDYLAGYLASDKLVGGQGRDRINASQGNNVVWGDSDPVEAGLPDTQANRQLMASIGSGQRLESLDNDILSTLDGNDAMYGGPGADSMTLGGGNDWAYGGQGNDSIALGAGDDRGYGGDGNDTLTGAGGNDLVSGGEGNDTVSGDQGLDVLIGGGGDDGVNGGDGNDLLFDGRLSLGGEDADSQTIGDASDAAMLALLLEWSATSPAAGPLALAAAASNDHDGTDQVRGHAGADRFSADPADILDFELGLDAIL